MHSVHALIVDLTLITIYAGITTLIFKKLKQPMVLGYLLAGILAGPYFNFVPTVTDNENLGMWAEIGVIFCCLGWDWNSVSKNAQCRQSCHDNRHD